MNRSHTVWWIAGALAVAATACRLDPRDDYLGDKDPKQFNLGRTATAAEVAAEDIDVSPNGAGLPAGSGTPEQGAAVYASACASCHGANGEGKPPVYPQLIGGPKTTFDFANNPKIPRTIGNYWPYATTLYDYIRRAMPRFQEGTLKTDEVYSLTAFILYRNDIIKEDDVIDAKTLPKIKMPNRDGFIPQNLDEIHDYKKRGCKLGHCP